MSSSVFFVAVAVTLLTAANAAKVPEGWKLCSRSLPPAEYDPCFKNGVSGALDELFSKGAPTLNIPPLSPLKIPMLEIGEGTGPVAVDIKLTDLELSNLESLDLVKIRHIDVESYKFGADIVFKKPVILTSKYEMSGKVLVLPIKGKGDCKLQFDNLRASLDMYGVPNTKGEVTYMNVTQMLLTFDTDKLHIKFDNLFDGNKELGDNMNLFLNENWNEILRELKPSITEALGLSFKNIAAQIFNSIPYNKLFPA